MIYIKFCDTEDSWPWHQSTRLPISERPISHLKEIHTPPCDHYEGTLPCPTFLCQASNRQSSNHALAVHLCPRLAGWSGIATWTGAVRHTRTRRRVEFCYDDPRSLRQETWVRVRNCEQRVSIAARMQASHFARIRYACYLVYTTRRVGCSPPVDINLLSRHPDAFMSMSVSIWSTATAEVYSRDGKCVCSGMAAGPEACKLVK
ncbi:hypothetical protein JB92DRAFT_2877511 [Gautieria morchelliformis]|nr:hypothetical protein JB92DRAFT_2877511 [Gautieria morchelliformis]